MYHHQGAPGQFGKVTVVVYLDGLAAQGVNNTMNVEMLKVELACYSSPEDDHHERRHHSVSCFRRTWSLRARV